MEEIMLSVYTSPGTSENGNYIPANGGNAMVPKNANEIMKHIEGFEEFCIGEKSKVWYKVSDATPTLINRLLSNAT